MDDAGVGDSIRHIAYITIVTEYTKPRASTEAAAAVRKNAQNAGFNFRGDFVSIKGRDLHGIRSAKGPRVSREY